MEQLIRDYLKRLSRAARAQLGPDDSRALVDRTRELIGRQIELVQPRTPMEVARLLSGFGDPTGLVEQERERLTILRGKPPDPEPIGTRFPGALRRPPIRARPPSWRWPVQEGDRSDLQATLPDDGALAAAALDAAPSANAETGAAETTTAEVGTPEAGTPGAGAAETSAAEASAADASAPTTSAAGRRDMNGTARNGLPRDYPTGGLAESAARIPAQGGEPSWFMLALGGRGVRMAQQSGESADATQDRAPARPHWPPVVTRNASAHQRAASDAATPAESVSSTVSPAWQLTMPREPVLPKQVRRALNAGAAWYRRGPLAAWAVLLLGLGGVIYPPVWLLGAVIALASRTWELRDKGIGLGLPFVLTLIGTAIGVASGGHVSGGQGVHEGWVYGVAASRIAAVLSACYLAWRRGRGRRPPAVPPWNRPHNIG